MLAGKGEIEKKLIDAQAKWLGLAVHFFKLVPAIIALAAMNR